MEVPAAFQQPRSLQMLAASRRFIRWLTRPEVILALIMLFLMFYMVIIPLYRMIMTTVTWQPRDVVTVPEAEVGGLTLYHYTRMLTGALGKIYMYTPLRHSLTIATGATFLSLFIGGSLAWLVVRTDMPGRKLVNQLALVPYIMPSWTLAQAWLVFFKNRLSGGTAGVFEYLVGHSPPNWLAYGPVPIMICSALHYYTFFFLFVSAALMSIDSNLEEAGELAGASRWRILRKITFPLVLPAILSGVIMTFSKVLGTFGGPNILGTPVRYYVVATMIRGSIGVGDRADALVLAIVLILFSMTIINLNQKLIGTRRSYETIGGRGFVAQVSKLGKLKKVMIVCVIIFQILVIVIPLGLLVWSSLMLQDGNYSLSNLSLQHWTGERGTIYNHGEPGVLRNPKIYRTAWNSIRLSLWTAFFTALIGVLLGYAIVKGRGTRLSKLVEQLAFIPYVIPGIAFGAVYIAMFVKPLGPLPALYGTFALLVVVSVAKHIPYSSRSGVSAMMQVGRELEEAAQVSGAKIWRRFRHIIFPLTSSGFVSGFLLTFITTMRELSLIILLVTPETQVLASQTMFYIENGDGQMANVVILILITLVAIGNFIISRFRGGSLKKGLGM
ncbi:MAG: iron ABC transporter permease [Anaerolineales bacterium]|nr:MAG: iron ABC transporter permease [Anaerolineales bacterium]